MFYFSPISSLAQAVPINKNSVKFNLLPAITPKPFYITYTHLDAVMKYDSISNIKII